MKLLCATLYALALLGIHSVRGQEFPSMIFVQGGSYVMGNPTSKIESTEYSNRSAVMVKDFYMGRTEVTVQQWMVFMKETDMEHPLGLPSWGWNANDPIAGISWRDAVEYCEWLSKNTGHHYRLPTEEEWEWAARGGKMSKGYKYSGSNNPNTVAWYEDNSDNRLHACGSKEPNELGLYDMSGNVAEFCSSYYKEWTGGGNPPSYHARLVRGGCYDDSPDDLLYFRWLQNPGNRNIEGEKLPYNIGFRVVRN